MTPLLPEFQDLLTKCLVNTRAHSCVSHWQRRESTWPRTFSSLPMGDAGILVFNWLCTVRFSSPLTARCSSSSKRLSSKRLVVDVSNPSSLQSLVKLALSNMSASVLSPSTTTTTEADDEEYPRESFSKQELLQGLALFTRQECAICCELVKVFSNASVSASVFASVSDDNDGEIAQ